MLRHAIWVAIFTSGLYQLLHQFGVQEGSVYEQVTGVAETGYTMSPGCRDCTRRFIRLESFTAVGRRDMAGASFLIVKTDRMVNGGDYWRIGERWLQPAVAPHDDSGLSPTRRDKKPCLQARS